MKFTLGTKKKIQEQHAIKSAPGNEPSQETQTTAAYTEPEKTANIEKVQYAVADKKHAGNKEKWDSIDFTRKGKEARRYSRITRSESGKSKASFYSVPMSFYDANTGELKDVDTTLEDTGDCYKTKANRFSASFDKRNADGKIFDLAKKDCKLSLFSKDIAARDGREIKVEDCVENGYKTSKAVISDAAEGVDYEYIVDYEKVKENIIIREKADAYEYDFTFDTEGLMLGVSEDGKMIELRSRETGNTLYYIPAPYMYDGAGEVSEDVYYEVNQTSPDSFDLKVVADKEWIEEDDRVFPVTIDPQVCVILFSGNVLDDPYEYGYPFEREKIGYLTENDSLFYYKAYRNGVESEEPFMVYTHADAYNPVDVHGQLIIDKSSLDSYMLEHMTKAILTVHVYTYSYFGKGVYIEGNCYTKSDMEKLSYKVSLDITNRLKNSSEDNISISFTYYSYRGFEGDMNVGFHSPVIEIDYEKEYADMKQVDEGDIAKGNVEIRTGRLVSSFDDMNLSAMSVPLKISHYHNNNGASSNLGIGWNLNLDKTLKTSTRDTSSTTVYTYTDEFKNTYDFTETYYYKDGSSIQYVSKDSVVVDSEGNLTYNNKKVYTRQRCFGNTLIPEIKDFSGSDYLETRSDSVIELKNTVTSYEASLPKYSVVDPSTGASIYSASSLSKSNYEMMLSKKSTKSSYVIMTESERLQMYQLYMSITNYENEISDDNEDIAEYKSKNDGNDYTTQISRLNRDIDTCNNYISFAKEQISLLKSQAADDFTSFKNAYKAYFNKKEELETEQFNTPVNYFIDSDGIINCFNSDGYLVYLMNQYGAYVAIERDTDGTIKDIIDSADRKVTFSYDDSGYLASITDYAGNTAKYTYASGKLIQIALADGRTLDISYSGNNVQGFFSSDEVTCNISYDVNERPAEFVTARNSEQIEDINLSYDATGITFTDSEGRHERYDAGYSGRMARVTSMDKAGYIKDISYTYATEDERETVTSVTTNSLDDSVETVIKEYDADEKLIRTTTDWKQISDTVKVMSVEENTYDEDGNLLSTITTKTIAEDNCEDKTIVRITTHSYNSYGERVLTGSYVEGEEDTLGISYKESTFDDNGHEIRTATWNSLDSSSKFYTEKEYTDDGSLAADLDETGVGKTTYMYENGSENVRASKLPDGSIVAYGYDKRGRVTSVARSTDEDEENCNRTYYNKDKISGYSSGNNHISYDYDAKGRLTKVNLNDTEGYLTYSYEEGDTDTTEIATVNGENVSVEYNKSGNVLKIMCEENTLRENEYDSKQRLVSVKDGVTSGVTEYQYDDYDHLTGISVTGMENGDNLSETISYNQYGEKSSIEAISGGTYILYDIEYKGVSSRSIDHITLPTGYRVYPLTDANGRSTGKELTDRDGNRIAGEYVSYRKVGDHATSMEASEYYGNTVKGRYVIKENKKYAYDSAGNITKVYDCGKLVTRYTYDKTGRVVREDNRKLGTTTIVTYDTCGNILSRRTAPYTFKDEALISSYSSERFFTYDGDRLMSIDDEDCAYDELGNPVMYRGDNAVWKNGRQLVSLGDNSFAYDGSSRRIKKNDTTYTYDGEGRLIKQCDSSNVIIFLYDNDGLTGFIHNGTVYYYRRNTLGDIEAILDTDGAVVIRYTYDAWGNHVICDANGNEISGDSIGSINPYRYRGYYYDTETGLYYLTARYYDPETGRFINVDDISYIDPDSINGLNLYVYCYNNPVMYTDPSGEAAWWEWLAGVLVVVAVTALVVVTAGVAAAVIGASAAVVTGVMVGAAVGGLTVGITNCINQGLSEEGFNYSTLALSTFVGASVGAIAGGFSSTVTLSNTCANIICNVAISLGKYFVNSTLTNTLNANDVAISILEGIGGGVTIGMYSVALEIITGIISVSDFIIRKSTS